MADILHFPALDLPATPAPTEPAACQPAPGRPAAFSDAEARADALDTLRSFIVEAPAGSGKTGLLVQRFLKLLADSEVAQPEEVLAMTFTRKATAEMQERVLEQLQAAHAQLQAAHLRTPLSDDASPFARQTFSLAHAVLARSAQRGWDLLNQPQRLNIRSLDSICMEIAKSLPLLSGSGASGEPVEDAQPLYRLAARRTLLQLGDPGARALDKSLHTVLLHRDGNLADCESLLSTMLAARAQWGELIPLGPNALDDAELDRQVRPRLERALENIVCAGLSRALQAIPPHLLDELTELASLLGLEDGYDGGESPIQICAGRTRAPEARAEHLDHWIALINLLLTKDSWRRPRGITNRNLGFMLPKHAKPRLIALIDAIQSDPLLEVLQSIRTLPPDRYPDHQWAVAKALFHVLRHALAELKLIFVERGQCDYTELTLAARQALHAPAGDAENPWASLDESLDAAHGPADIALSAGGRLRHLLVDEMQDTSSSQYELIKLLTASWDGHSQTLFLVGDPKQSIYLFREARVERFLRTMHDCRLGDIPLTPLRLTSNFRSQAALVHSFNDTFGGEDGTGRIFPAPADGRQTPGAPWPSPDVPFVAATPTRLETTPDAIRWHTAVLGEEPLDPTLRPTGIPAADHTAQEAIEIRRLIEQRLALPLPPDRDGPHARKPWSIAVLGRARNHLAAIVQELKAHDGKPAIPFRAVDLDPLDELPEVLDALALTRALLHPADRIAWLAVLHAPWCGLGMADLLDLTGEGDLEPHGDPEAGPGTNRSATVATLVRTRRQHLSSLGQRLLDRIWPILEAAVATLGRTPLSVHVERTWRSLGGDAALSREQCGNVLRFLRVLREVEADGGPIDPAILTTRLKNLFAEPAAGKNIQVDLMTIHKAKGLEWDVVLLPGLHRKPRGSGAGLLNWLELDGPANDPAREHEEASILLAPIWGKGRDSDKLNDWLRAARGRRERAEEKRLFYVASTRAGEQLHIFAAVERRDDGELALPASGTLLKACWPAAESYFAPLAAGAPAPPQTSGGPFIEQPDRARGGEATNLSEFPAFRPGLDLAASTADPAASANGHAIADAPPTLQRLPLSFDPQARFTDAAAHRLPYTPASALNFTPIFERPEGGFGARAFGNVVHRYLQVIAARLADPVTTPEALLSELPSWEPRLDASLRGEGLPPAAAVREAGRALRALTLTLGDPTGRWILSPHAAAASEQSLTMAAAVASGVANRRAATSLRIDRTFVAGASPSTSTTGLPASPAEIHAPCIWIVDFKTTDPGSRSADSFAAAEIAKYAAQLEAYATLRRTLPDGRLPIRIGLFYPLIPRLLHWPSASNLV